MVEIHGAGIMPDASCRPAMRVIHIAIVTGLVLLGAVAAAPTATAGPDGFGHCELNDESYGHVSLGPVDRDIVAPTDLECYW